MCDHKIDAALLIMSFFYINYLHKFEMTLYGQHAAIVVFEKHHILGTSIFSFYSVYIYFYWKQSDRLYCGLGFDVDGLFQSPHEQ